MLMAYVDESGDAGYSGSRTYTLGCALVRDSDWPDSFDAFLNFRRFLRVRFNIRMRDELKSNYVIHGGGPLKDLNIGDKQRRAIYRQHMRLAHKIGVDVFAVVIQKELIRAQGRFNPRDVAWEFLLQRLERFSTKSGEPVFVTHDEGESLKIRALARKARRANMPGSAFGTKHLRLPARLLIDDPAPRDSKQSYFIQLADFAAYAAFRRIQPYQGSRFQVCHSDMWDELGRARFAPANELSQAQGKTAYPGIAVWPTQ